MTMKGFTVIELIVSVAIIALISGIVFSNGRGFNDRLELSGALQDTSLAIREAQTYAVSVRETTSNTGQFSYSYGAVLSTIYPSYIIIFADKNNNGTYDGGTVCDGSDECVEKIILRNSVKITGLCATDSFGTQSCPQNWASLQFIFHRPNPDALIVPTNNLGRVVSGPWQAASVTLLSRFGIIGRISVNSAGQISIK